MSASVARSNIIDLRPSAATAPAVAAVEVEPKPISHIKILGSSLLAKLLPAKKPEGISYLHPVSSGILGGLLAVIIIGVVLPSLPAQAVSPVGQVAPALAPSQTPTAPAIVAKAKAPVKPTDHLLINRIGINASVSSIGLTKEGAIDTPKTLWQVGHYDKSAAVGATGTAVIVGHSGAPGQVGVFEHINRVQVGDIISYTRIDGTSVSYRVTSSAAYPVNDDTARLLVAPTSYASLNLISCYGNWDQAAFKYDQRWIVKSQLVK
ncbi:MAG: class F sortase [Candidatus Saccharibacteria bacterium]